MPSSGPGGNSAKKLTRKLSQSTLRRLVTFADTLLPAMSNVSVSPSFTPSVSAMPSSSDMPASAAGVAARPERAAA